MSFSSLPQREFSNKLYELFLSVFHLSKQSFPPSTLNGLSIETYVISPVLISKMDISLIERNLKKSAWDFRSFNYVKILSLAELISTELFSTVQILNLNLSPCSLT